MVGYSKRIIWLAVLLVVALLPAAHAQEKARKLTAMDEFNIQTATDPQISPDGKKIAYVRGFADPMTDRRYTNLWIINADGADPPRVDHRKPEQHFAALVARLHP